MLSLFLTLFIRSLPPFSCTVNSCHSTDGPGRSRARGPDRAPEWGDLGVRQAVKEGHRELIIDCSSIRRVPNLSRFPFRHFIWGGVSKFVPGREERSI